MTAQEAAIVRDLRARLRLAEEELARERRDHLVEMERLAKVGLASRRDYLLERFISKLHCQRVLTREQRERAELWKHRALVREAA